MSKRVLVIGGTGMLGLPVARQLQADGYDVSIMTSHIDRARSRLGSEFRLVEGDVTRPETLRGPIGEANFVHLNLNSHLDPEMYRAIEIEGTANVAKVASEAGIERLSMITGASSRGELGGRIYLDAKVLAERAVIESGVPYTIMRPSWFFESLPGFVQGKRVLYIGHQPVRRYWLAARDYARQVSAALANDKAVSRCFYNLGPLKMTMHEALTLFCRRVCPDVEPESMSFFNMRLLSVLPGQRALRQLVGFFKYMENMPEPEADSEADRLLGPNLTTLEEWLDGYPGPNDAS